jgi:hypothetical protein
VGYCTVVCKLIRIRRGGVLDTQYAWVFQVLRTPYSQGINTVSFSGPSCAMYCRLMYAYGLPLFGSPPCIFWHPASWTTSHSHRVPVCNMRRSDFCIYSMPHGSLQWCAHNIQGGHLQTSMPLKIPAPLPIPYFGFYGARVPWLHRCRYKPSCHLLQRSACCPCCPAPRSATDTSVELRAVVHRLTISVGRFGYTRLVSLSSSSTCFEMWRLRAPVASLMSMHNIFAAL